MGELLIHYRHQRRVLAIRFQKRPAFQNGDASGHTQEKNPAMTIMAETEAPAY
jgi:hypothetical protein